MPLRTFARQTAEELYSRFVPHSFRIDKFNRLPLLAAFADEHSAEPCFPTREAMWDYLAGQTGAVIDYLEFGVHEGHSILHWAKTNTADESRFFGFDTFSGLPEDWNKDYPKGKFDTGGRAPESSDQRVHFIRGLFQETLPTFLETFASRSPLVVNIDCDLYSSALFCLTRLDPFIAPGTILIFDEFGDVLHEFRAFHDYLAAYRRDYRVVCSHDDFYTAAVRIV